MGAARHDQPRHLVPTAPPPSAAPSSALAARRQLDAPPPEVDEFWALVRRLPDRQAAAVALHYLDDLSIAEIADALGCAEGTAKAHLHQARRTLAEQPPRRPGARTMTDPHDPDLDAVDRAARAASRGLHDHVDRQVEPELMLAALPAAAPTRNRGRLLAAAAVVAAVHRLGRRARRRPRTATSARASSSTRTATSSRPRARHPHPARSRTTGATRSSSRSRWSRTSTWPTARWSPSRGPGFVPGERVGIVQCASEAGEGNGATREERAGIDGCNIGTVQYADADDDGSPPAPSRWRGCSPRPAPARVDCALEASAASSPWAPSTTTTAPAGSAWRFAGGGEPIDIPTVTVSPAEGLADGAVVHVEGEGFDPGPVHAQPVCSIDPSGCWYDRASRSS